MEANYLRAAHVQPHGRLLTFDDDQMMWFAADELRNLDLRRGDVVVVEGGAGFGRSAYVDEDMPGWGFQNSIIRIRSLDHRADGRFLNYALQSALHEGSISLVCSVATFPHFTAEKVAAFPLPAPSVGEQLRIADFLDRETAQIEALIEKQEKLVQQLQARRTETISSTVRRGVAAETRMRDTGIPWIGWTPEHWRVPQLRRIATMTAGAGFPIEEQGKDDEPYPFYKVNALGRAEADGRITARYDTISATTAARLRASVVPAETLVMAKIGAALLLGRIRVLCYDSCIDNNMLAVTPRAGVHSRFLYYALQDVKMDLLVNPGAVPSLSERAFRSYQLPLPPFEEQQAISAYLDGQTTAIDLLIRKANAFIELARERRAALITAAVTGQLDIARKEAA